MLAILRKEISAFFASLIGYVVIGVFLAALGLLLWYLPDSSILENGYAQMDGLFELAPWVFMFLVPAVCMRSFAEEQQQGTLELLVTRPLTDLQIVLGKYLASVMLVLLALLPTGLYFYSVYALGSPVGNLDKGGIFGSYIGLFLLASAFCAIGVFASSLTQNQIVAFVLAAFLCFFLWQGFDMLSRLPVFFGKTDDLVQRFGMEHHYRSVSRGILDSRDVVYFLSIIAFFIGATLVSLSRRFHI